MGWYSGRGDQPFAGQKSYHLIGHHPSPTFVVWEGSHEITRAVMSERFGDLPPDQWGDEDVTKVYHQLRRTVFESCERVEITASVLRMRGARQETIRAS